MEPAEKIMYPVSYVAHIGDNIVDVLKMIDEAEISNIPVLDGEERLAGLFDQQQSCLYAEQAVPDGR